MNKWNEFKNFIKKKECEKIKCNYCGRFISYNDLNSGKAYYQMVLPDSDCSIETWEGCCGRCKEVK